MYKRIIFLLVALFIFATAYAIHQLNYFSNIVTKHQTHAPPPPVINPKTDETIPSPVTPPPPENLPTPELTPSKPASGIRWKLIDQRNFSELVSLESYHPYYVIHVEQYGARGDGINLDSSYIHDCWIRLAKQTPHTVKWELEFTPSPKAIVAALRPEGVVFTHNAEGISLVPYQNNTLTITRSGTELGIVLNGNELNRTIDVDDRTPLLVKANIFPVVLISTKLYFGNGENLSTPPQPKPGIELPPEWEIVYTEDFSKASSVDVFEAYPDPNCFRWDKKFQALELNPNNLKEGYIMLKKSLPGDLRVRFRARSANNGTPPRFGCMLGLAGTLLQEDGYFLEWNNFNHIQIKKVNVQMVDTSNSFHDSPDHDGWRNFAVQRLGGTLSMQNEGREVLKWKDTSPYQDNAHDLFLFYFWSSHFKIDDLIIERNKLDPLKPRADQPAVNTNYEQGMRDPKPGTTDSTGSF